MNIEVSDEDFNSLYPADIQQLAKRHWTPLEVAKTAVEFLTETPNSKVLDIGRVLGNFASLERALLQRNSQE